MKIVRATIALGAVVFFGAIASTGVRGQAQRARRSDTEMQVQIEAQERAGLNDLKTGDLEDFRKLMAEDGVFVDAQARSTREQVMAAVGGFRLTDFSMTQVKFLRVGAETGLISYEFNDHGVTHGRPFTTHSYVSSLWTRRGGRWVCLFSQSSTVEPRRK